MQSAYKGLLGKKECLHELRHPDLFLYDSAKPRNDKLGKKSYCGLLYYVCKHCGLSRKKQKDILKHLESHNNITVQTKGNA